MDNGAEEDRERDGSTSSSTTWRTCSSTWRMPRIELNGEGEPVWLTPHLRDPQPEGEREMGSWHYNRRLLLCCAFNVYPKTHYSLWKCLKKLLYAGGGMHPPHPPSVSAPEQVCNISNRYFKVQPLYLALASNLCEGAT